MFHNFRHPLESLHVSYNNLTPKAVEVIGKSSYEIKVLHMAKCPIKSKGGTAIGYFLKNL